ncbi:MAG TPA: glucose-1-phosphate adenylyltransferase [Halanaerobiales bacterium]|nr:glucose-1-phosphate adenylyltransferase [Halanaerobiales bacterium]
MKTLALILAGGRGSRLDILSEHRAKPSVPFAGKYRLIDFVLSNCVNSGIYNVGVLTQYLPLSLNDHIGIGKPWDLDRKYGGITILQPYTGKEGGWYKGTAHAIYQNMSYLRSQDPEYVLILSGDHLYKMNYDKMVEDHIDRNADLSIAAQRVPQEDASRFGILDTDKTGKITDFLEKPENPPNNLASMGIYVFTKDALIKALNKYCSAEKSDFGHHVIPPMIKNNEVYAYEYEGYWRDVGTLKSFWETNLSLTESIPELNLYDEDWKVHTKSVEKPPVKFGPNSKSKNSLLSNGAIINGIVENSVISPGVYIEENVVVRNSIIFNDTRIRKNTIVDKCIIDKEVDIGENCHIGFGDDLTPNEEKPDLLFNGLNIIAKRAVIPNNVQIGRNCRVMSYTREKDFDNKNIESGSTIG